MIKFNIYGITMNFTHKRINMNGIGRRTRDSRLRINGKDEDAILTTALHSRWVTPDRKITEARTETRRNVQLKCRAERDYRHQRSSNTGVNASHFRVARICDCTRDRECGSVLWSVDLYYGESRQFREPTGREIEIVSSCKIGLQKSMS